MKKSLIFPFLLFLSLKANAQITLDTAINNTLGIGYGFKLVQISSTETKWFFSDTTTNTFNLYNIDFTPFMMNIAVPEPFDLSNSVMQALYITRALFDCDTSNVEYAYYSAYNVGKPFRVMRTDGTLLFQLDSANGPYAYGAVLGGSDVIKPIVNTSAGAKLFLQPYPLQSPIYVYSLCGTLPNDVFDFSEINNTFVTLFPNPASKSLTFKINPPDNMNEYELVIMDATAREIARQKVNCQKNNLTINIENLSGGTYFYSLQNKTKIFQAGKFILTK